MNAMNEHLFYVKTIKNDGASCKILKIGDRLLKVLFLKTLIKNINKMKICRLMSIILLIFNNLMLLLF